MVLGSKKSEDSWKCLEMQRERSGSAREGKANRMWGGQRYSLERLGIFCASTELNPDGDAAKVGMGMRTWETVPQRSQSKHGEVVSVGMRTCASWNVFGIHRHPQKHNLSFHVFLLWVWGKSKRDLFNQCYLFGFGRYIKIQITRMWRLWRYQIQNMQLSELIGLVIHITKIDGKILWLFD